MRFVLGFFFGLIIGAASALLLAPSSGEDFRQNIKSQTDTQVARLQDEWQKGMQQMQTRIDKLSSDLQSKSTELEEVIQPE